MPVSTIESAFVLVDRASGPIRGIRRELRGMQRDAEAAGLAVDHIGNPKSVRDLDRLASETRSVRSEVRGLSGDVRPADRTMSDFDSTLVRTGTHARGASRDIGDLTGRTKLLGATAALALPAVDSLGGAATALAGSLMGAGLGAGAIGLAGGGTLVAGIGALVAVGKPAETALKNVTKEQQAYTKAVQDYGSKSREAALAQQQLDRTYAQNPGIQRATSQLHALNKEWDRLTAPGRQQLLGLVGDVSQVARRAAPRMARDANMVATSTRTAGTNQARFLAGDFSQDTLAAFTREFSTDLPIAERTLENMEVTLGRIARESLPFFHDGVKWVERTTEGWRSSTTDVAKLRREIGGYVGDLTAWGHLTESAFGLAKDVLMGGRPAGRSAVEDLTHTLDRWDEWVQRNPVKIEKFFDTAVQSTEDLAGGLGEVVKDLHGVAEILTPVLSRLAQLAQIGGGLGLLAPTAIRFGLSRLGGGTGGAGVLPMVAGGAGMAAMTARATQAEVDAGLTSSGAIMLGGATVGQQAVLERRAAAAAARTAPSAFAAARGAVGSRLAGPLATAGRFLGPLAVIQGGLGAAEDPGGAGLLGRWRDITSSLSLGLIDSQSTVNNRANNKNLGALQDYVTRLPGSENAYGGARRQITSLRGLRGRVDASDAPADQRHTLVSAIDQEIQARKDLLPGLLAERGARSRDKGAAQGQSVATAFRSDLTHLGADKAVAELRSNLLGPGGVASRNFPGGRQLADAGLQALRDAAQTNPKLAKAYKDLTSDVSTKFDDLGRHVVDVNGNILSASAKDWPRIRDALANPAEQARQRVSTAFSQIQEQAVGSLTQMGYSAAQARQIVRGAAGNGTGAISSAVSSAKNVQSFITSPSGPSAQAFGPSPGHLGSAGPFGDGLGLRGAAVGATAGKAAGLPGLMGANSNLEPYAVEASRFGLNVTSGLRPGAHTVTGGLSYHATGHAIDESGPAAGMLAYAKFMVQNHGSGLEELIHTPLGFGIKNGKRVPLSFWGSTINAMHENHVHVADTDPSAGGKGVSTRVSMDTASPGMRRVSLRAPRSGLPGVPGALADAAASAYASGLERHINASAGGTGRTGRVSAGGKLGKAALEHLWIAAGGPPGVANVEAAIALAESGGNPNAVNVNTNGTKDRGLWQINDVWGALSRFGDLPNARSAVQVYDKQGLGAWATYNSGAYKQFVGDGSGWGPARVNGSYAPSGGSAARMNAAPSAGTSIAIGPLHVHGDGHQPDRIRAIVQPMFDEFSHAVVAAIASEDDSQAVMS